MNGRGPGRDCHLDDTGLAQVVAASSFADDWLALRKLRFRKARLAERLANAQSDPVEWVRPRWLSGRGAVFGPSGRVKVASGGRDDDRVETERDWAVDGNVATCAGAR